MKVKIVRHDRGAKDADGDVEHFAVAKYFRAREKPDSSFVPKWMSEEDLIREARGDGANQRNDESLYEAEPAALQGKNEENVASGEDAKFRRESLQEHRHQIADQYDAEKRVAEFRAAAQVGSPVARVHVAHGYQIARPREGQNLAEPVRAGSDGNRAMGFGQGRDGREPGPVYCGEGVSGGFSGEGGVRFELWRSSGFHR